MPDDPTTHPSREGPTKEEVLAALRARVGESEIYGHEEETEIERAAIRLIERGERCREALRRAAEHHEEMAELWSEDGPDGNDDNADYHRRRALRYRDALEDPHA